jgi:energy-coupling factor transporter ATP-binding protein EcfA2
VNDNSTAVTGEPFAPEAGAAARSAYDRDLLREQMEILRRESAVRARLESEIRAEHDAATKSIRGEAEQAIAATTTRLGAEIDAARQEHTALLHKAAAHEKTERAKWDERLKSESVAIRRRFEQAVRQADEEDAFEESSFGEVLKEKRKDPQRLFVKSEKEFAASLAQVAAAEQRAAALLAARGVASPVASADVETDNAAAASGAAAAPPTSGPDGGSPPADPLPQFEAQRAAVLEHEQSLAGLRSARLAFAGGTLGAAVCLPLVIGGTAAAVAFFQGQGEVAERAKVAGIVAGVVTPLALGVALWGLGRLRRAARAGLAEVRVRFLEACREAAGLEPACRAFLTARRDDQLRRIDEKFARDKEARREAAAGKRTALAEKRDKALADLTTRHAAEVQAVVDKVAAVRTAAEQKYPPRIAALETTRREDVARLEGTRDEALARADGRRAERYGALTARWKAVREGTAAVYAEAAAIDAGAFRSWDDLARDDVPLPAVAPPGLRFGSLALTLEKVPGGVSVDPALNAFGPVSWTQPAIVPYPADASLVVETDAEQKEVASAFMQGLMLRIATGIPPGQSRFTIIDPLGLGKQFAGFMHLADHDELLVTSRIWTEPQLIEQRLADITEQMEVVIQKYLRNEYASIGDYNAIAEVPEPYRFVVVANFPANFNETSARRLASIAASGPRCGVYTIVSVDVNAQMPAGFDLADLARHATVLGLEDGVFTWRDPEFSRWPLTVEQPPADDVFTTIIQRVGRAAKAAKRVEVPFDRVAPAEADWWKGSTASEVLAPLGPAGAKKLQYLKLGRGTSQHCLIAGKTGSGKSTLMHAMITSLALQYSPSEIQFYLIDFKKGVEFKLYDHYRLPHARVIAIESEREFGLSVLEQLDRELKRRGDLFRDQSVQDVAGFRRTGHPDPMPRILLLIDEFQEIFVEDDKIAQDAALILDRLVRQGRAFGMHVLLGSQTLGGSYSLPRATMGQMAVRIALQCNEADSSLILSEDNTAARLLTRPGEAIYNDANGMVEGNNPFQVVFLNDDRRERYLGALRALADRRTDIPQLPRIVFDGNQAADPAGNPLLTELLESGTVRGREPGPPLAWLGDAIAIKDPTAAVFRRQGGANLLVVGQREDLGTSLLALAIVSLATGHDPHPGGGLGRAARFVVFEPAIAEEKPDTMLARLADHLPHEIEVAGRLGVAAAIEAVATEIKRRLDEQVLDGESVFVVIRDLGRFRELRKNDGDFGYSFGDKKAGPADHLLTILKDGPTVGVHALIWCDSLTNLQRTFDRNAIKEFELRVLFQMSGNDSSQLIDSPAAARLGPQRALFIHEETGTLEKFRPYSFPTPEWLAGVASQMRARPQGTPKERSRPPAAGVTGGQAAAGGETPAELGSFTGFGGGDFNFTKLLDDTPDEAPADEGQGA